MNTHCVYKITAPSGHFYIGVTNDLERRLSEHPRYEKTPLGRAFRKYGKESMKIETLLEGTLEEAYKLENELLPTRASLKGTYNQVIGGRGGSKSGYGIQQLDKEGNFLARYETLAEVLKVCGFDQSRIAKVCKSGHKGYDYFWRYENGPKAELQLHMKNYGKDGSRPVVKISPKGEEIKRYASASEAAREIASELGKQFGTVLGNISNKIKRKRTQKAYGYYWDYV
jgi:predicted GIY-YIG superfamily endonuclease